MREGLAKAPLIGARSFVWNEEQASWATEFEHALAALIAKTNRLSDTNLVYLLRTALALNEAVAAMRMKGQLVDGEMILSIIALAGRGSAVAWEGVAIYRLAQYLASCDPAHTLSQPGIFETMRRLNVFDPQKQPDASEDRIHLSAAAKGTVIDACLELRRLWLRVPNLDGTGLTAARLLTAPLFLQICGHPLVFLGAALGAKESTKLREALTDDTAWISALMPILARAAQASHALTTQVISSRNRWLHRLTRGKDQASTSGLDTVFVQPILSTANMITLQERLTGKAPSLRTAQSWMTTLQTANIVTRVGKDASIWRAHDQSLMGRI